MGGVVVEKIEKLKDQLVFHEGIRFELYKCPAGRWTIGVGRNLSDSGISKDEAFYLLKNDLSKAEGDLRQIFEGFDGFAPGRQFALIDLRFNLGPSGFRSFRRMIAAIRAESWSDAAAELVDSRWWGQVQAARRATLHRQILTGAVDINGVKF